jgi:hypothetical protein
VSRPDERYATKVRFRERLLLLETVDELMAQTLFNGHFDLRALLVGELEFG